MVQDFAVVAGAPGSNPVQGLLLLFSFYLLAQVLGQSNLNGGLYFIWSKLTMKDKPSFEEEIVLVERQEKSRSEPGRVGVYKLYRIFPVISLATEKAEYI